MVSKGTSAKADQPQVGSGKAGSGKSGPGKPSLAVFVRQVRAEMLKVTWPSRRETGISTVMVLVMVLLACCFFLLSDWVIATFVSTIIGFFAGIFQ